MEIRSLSHSKRVVRPTLDRHYLLTCVSKIVEKIANHQKSETATVADESLVVEAAEALLE